MPSLQSRCQNILSAMRPGEWHTREELAHAIHNPLVLTPRPSGPTEPLIDLVYSGKLCGVLLEGNEDVPLYHNTPKEDADAELGTRYFTPGTDLPPELRRTLLIKAEELHRAGKLSHPAPQTLRTLQLVDEKLERLGLLETKPRPALGFQYSCSWRPSNFFPVATSPRPRIRILWIKFVGRIASPLPTAPSDRPLTGRDRQYHLKLKTAWATVTVRQRPDHAAITIKGVSSCTINSRTPGRVNAPTRQALVHTTRRLINKSAEQTDETVPFTPIKCGFQLLTNPPQQT